MKMIFNAMFKAAFTVACSALSISAFAAVNPCADVPHSEVQRDEKTHAFTGCKVLFIDTGSLYSDLGIQVGDVLQPDPPTKMKAKEMEAVLVNDDAKENRATE